MTTMTRRLTAACAALTLAAVPLLAQERGDANTIGIKVHGHWTIDVRKADGTLISHNEFENALTSTGSVGLAQILSRTYTVGGWGILLDGGVCQGSFSPSCVIMEPTLAQPAAIPDNNDLTVSVPAAGQSNAGFLVLKGSVRAATTGQITVVRTRQASCPSQVMQFTVGQCAAAADMITAPNVFDVTSRTLATPITVDAGQFIQVTVVLSFS